MVTEFPASAHSCSLSVLLKLYAFTAGIFSPFWSVPALVKVPPSIVTVPIPLYPVRSIIEIAAPSTIGPSPSVFSSVFPVTVIAVLSPVIVKSPAQI